MRKIIYAQLVSLDGYIEDQHGNIDWTAPGEELHRHFNDLEKSLDINFYGRRMSAAMDFWLTADQNPDLNDYEREYARLWQDTQRIVFSKTLDKVEGRAQLWREVNPNKINKLKKKPGGNMSVGGPNLASTFIKHKLVDEYWFYVHPVVLGSGKAMLPEGEYLNLMLIDSQTFSCGVHLIKYQFDK